MGTVGHTGQKVLVIDDDPVMHRLFGNILHQVGYTVMVANCGLTGLDLAEHDQPQIIILDYVMPDMDGLETLKELKSRESTRSIPVLIATGYLDAPSSEKFMTAGAAACCDSAPTTATTRSPWARTSPPGWCTR